MIETHSNSDKIYTAVSNDNLLNNPVKPTVMAETGYGTIMTIKVNAVRQCTSLYR